MGKISTVLLLCITAFISNALVTQIVTERILPPSAYDTILNGKIAVVPNFISNDRIADLRQDAMELHRDEKFSTDALASYGTSGKFDPTKDRAVLKLNQWKDTTLGSWETRKNFGHTMAQLRTDLAYHLGRPKLATGISTLKYGDGSTEISYTRFGPGAFLKRHVDEHHEELKGRDGWAKPTRRSVSWLIYLNEDWKKSNGGQLRCFERTSLPSHSVGARPNGDLQIGWLRASPSDPIERPVFLDSRRHDGNCAMYLDDTGSCQRQYITKDFFAHPILYMAGGESLTKKLLVDRKDLADRFHLIEPPKSLVGDMLALSDPSDEILEEIDPLGGTLVLFDSVALPHEVLATNNRERWASSGWMHEDQQPGPEVSQKPT